MVVSVWIPVNKFVKCESFCYAPVHDKLLIFQLIPFIFVRINNIAHFLLTQGDIKISKKS